MIIYYKGYLTNIGVTDTGAITNTREETVSPGKKPLSCIVDTQTSVEVGMSRIHWRAEKFTEATGLPKRVWEEIFYRRSPAGNRH